MTEDKVPLEEWPADAALKWQKRQYKKNKQKRKYYSSSCIACSKLFLKNPPPGIVIFEEHVIIEKNKIRIPFAVQAKGQNLFVRVEIHSEN